MASWAHLIGCQMMKAWWLLRVQRSRWSDREQEAGWLWRGIMLLFSTLAAEHVPSRTDCKWSVLLHHLSVLPEQLFLVGKGAVTLDGCGSQVEWGWELCLHFRCQQTPRAAHLVCNCSIQKIGSKLLPGAGPCLGTWDVRAEQDPWGRGLLGACKRVRDTEELWNVILKFLFCGAFC